MKGILEDIAACLRAPLAPEHRFVSGLLAFVALRLLTALLLVLDLPPLEGHVPPWYFHTGGDQDTYFRLASELAEGRISDDIVSLGTPLVMVPFIWLAHPLNYRGIVAPLVIINGFLLGGASVALIGLIGRDYTGDERVGLLGAALWMALPGFLYLGIAVHPAAELLRGSLLPKTMWLTGISDGPAAFGILLGVWALGRAFQRNSLRAYFLAGLGFGWAVMVRIQVAPVVALLLGILVVMRGWRGLLWVCVGGLTGYFPQAVFNTVEYGVPLYTGYLRNTSPGEVARRPLSEILTSLPYSPGALMSGLSYFIGRYVWLVPVLLVTVGVGIALLVILWRRRGWPYAAILLGVPVVNIVSHMAAFYFPSDPVRFTMLSYPYLLVLVAFLFFLLWQLLPESRRRWRLASPGPGAGDSPAESS